MQLKRGYLQMEHLQVVKSAIKRAKSMGKYHAYKPCYDKHPLAASICNHLDALSEELVGDRDVLEMYRLVFYMALAINKFCDNNKVAGNAGAEYWLEVFYLQYNNLIIDNHKDSLYVFEYVEWSRLLGEEWLNILYTFEGIK